MIHAVHTPLVSLEDVHKSFRTKDGVLTAVAGVSLHIHAGETLAVVGESGCGKSTLANLLLGLLRADSGTIAFDLKRVAATRKELDGKSGAQRGERSGRACGVVFQNPHASLDPRMKVHALVAEPLVTSINMRGAQLIDRVIDLLKQVGLGPDYLNRYPHELSGGQLQRVAIARALALDPPLVILDEPTAALDVSVRAQILKLLRKLQASSGASYLLITHDLATVEYIATRVIVMYLGRVVESGPVSDVFVNPKHPYTRALIDAIPTTDPSRRRRFVTLNGEVPNPLNRPNGCGFSPRCHLASDTCRQADPPLSSYERERCCACHHPLPPHKAFA